MFHQVPSPTSLSIVYNYRGSFGAHLLFSGCLGESRKAPREEAKELHFPLRVEWGLATPGKGVS
jgi:hypothetical protein